MVTKAALACGEWVLGKCPTASAHHRLLRPVTLGLSSSSSIGIRTLRTEESQRTSLPNLPHQLSTVRRSERITLVDVYPVTRDRWSTSFSHARVPMAVFKNLQLFHVLHFKFSCSLDHLRVQRQSSAPVSELLSTVSVVRATPAPPESAHPPLLRLSAVDLIPSALVPRRIPRLACSVAKRAVSLPPTVEQTFHKLSLSRSTVGCDRVHQNSVSSRPLRCAHHSS